MDHNFVLDAVKKQPEFVENIKQACEKLFKEDSKLESLWNKDGREIKAYRDDENSVIYVFDKTAKSFNIHYETIHDFNKNENTKKILYWDMKTSGGKKDLEKLHMSTVFSFGPPKKELPPGLSVMESLKENLKDKANDAVKSFKLLFGDNFETCSEFLELVGLTPKLNCSSLASTLQTFSKFLNEHNYMQVVYDTNFFEQLNDKACVVATEKLPNLVIEMNFLIKICKEHKFSSKKKAFEFNDLDNYVWLEKNKLTVIDQNCGFYFDIVDDNNFTVYFLDKEYKSVPKEIKRIDTAIAEGTINTLSDIMLKVENGVAVKCNYPLMYSFELDLEYSVRAMEEAGLGQRKFDVDIYSYKYQKDYYMHAYGYDEFHFLAQAFLTLGGGFEFDKERGGFVCKGVKYEPNLPEAPYSRDEKAEGFNYCYPKPITHLNEEWLDGLKYMVSVLKKDKPVPVAFEGEDPHKAVEKVVEYYEEQIANMEKKASKPKM